MSTFDEKPILQGVLWKRAQKSGSNWKKRYFKLFKNRLTYAIKENGKEKGVMNFTADYFVQDGIAPKGKFGFLVTDFETAHHLATDTKDQKDFWCHAIATVIRKQLELAKYFEEVRKSTKIVDQDLAEKQYQARLDNYYKTVGRPVDKQNRKSIVDFRAAQVLAEYHETAKLVEKASEAERESLRHEVDRLAKEAASLREQAEKGAHDDSVVVVGQATIPEGEEAAEDEDEEEFSEVIAQSAEEQNDSQPLTAVVTDVPSLVSPKSPNGMKQQPELPPRKNTIQPVSPNGSGFVGISESSLEEAPVARKTFISPASSQSETASVGQLTSPAMESRKVSVHDVHSSPSPAMSRPSVVALTQAFEKTDSSSNLASPVAARRPLMTSGGSSTDLSASPASRRPTGAGAVTELPPKSTTTIVSPESDDPVSVRKPSVAVTSPAVQTPPQPQAERKATIQTLTDPPKAVEATVSSKAPDDVVSPLQKAPEIAATPVKAPDVLSPPKPSSGIASKLGIWQNKVDQHQEKQSNNVFSGAYQGKGKIEISKDQYGKAPEGSKTEERAKAAQDWVEKEIEKLISVILEMGEYDPEEGGIKTVKFGPLFYKYADISDTLVGILMRAKKRKRVMYQGDMLFQTMHDHVKITVLA